jgi:hypothetical protein
MAITPENFIELSAVLSGVSATELPAGEKQRTADGDDTTLGQIYLDRLQTSYADELDALAAAWEAAKAAPDPMAHLQDQLTRPEAAELRKAARQIVKIWYLTIIDDPQDAKKQLSGDLGQYQHGIVWRLIRAHAPAYSYQQYGYWASKPNGKNPHANPVGGAS